MIGAGQLGPQAANAIRHVAAQNGVWSLGNFGGVPPRSAMSPAGQASDGSATVESQAASNDQHLIKSIEDHDYRFVFNSCVIGMVSSKFSFFTCKYSCNISLPIPFTSIHRPLHPWGGHLLIAINSSSNCPSTRSKRFVVWLYLTWLRRTISKTPLIWSVRWFRRQLTTTSLPLLAYSEETWRIDQILVSI